MDLGRFEISKEPSNRGGLDLGLFAKSNRPSRRGGLDYDFSEAQIAPPNAWKPHKNRYRWGSVPRRARGRTSGKKLGPCVSSTHALARDPQSSLPLTDGRLACLLRAPHSAGRDPLAALSQAPPVPRGTGRPVRCPPSDYPRGARTICFEVSQPRPWRPSSQEQDELLRCCAEPQSGGCCPTAMRQFAGRWSRAIHTRPSESGELHRTCAWPRRGIEAETQPGL